MKKFIIKKLMFYGDIEHIYGKYRVIDCNYYSDKINKLFDIVNRSNTINCTGIVYNQTLNMLCDGEINKIVT
jgi:hypothetical protein